MFFTNKYGGFFDKVERGEIRLSGYDFNADLSGGRLSNAYEAVSSRVNELRLGRSLVSTPTLGG